MAKQIISSVDIRDPYTDAPLQKITVILDSAADITDLGTNWCPGSIAIIPGGDVYMLNASKVWTVM